MWPAYLRNQDLITNLIVKPIGPKELLIEAKRRLTIRLIERAK